MILRRFWWSVLPCLTLLLAAKAQVKISEHGYENVLISFSPNVPNENGKDLVQSIQDILEESSNVLHTAIGIRIASATFLLPPSWTTEGWEGVSVNPPSAEQSEAAIDIGVDAAENSPFGKQPVALQHGGCGVGGHRIFIPRDFLSSSEEYSKGKMLAREWLKYRYGVFDENGFPGDPLYPDYYKIPGGSDIRVTDCTDSEVKYVFKKPDTDEVCDMDAEADFGTCRTHVEQTDNSTKVTSSLMYFHRDLEDMEHVCGQDDHPHHNTSRNKQNALCRGQSIWDVVKQSEDFKTTQLQSEDPDPQPIQFSFIQESKPRFVVLVENTDTLHDQQSGIRFALKRFYYDLPAHSKLAIYKFIGEVTEALTYTDLPAEGRPDLGPIADFGSPASASVCTSCSIEKAAQLLLEKSEVEGGTIFLLTASPLDRPPALPEKLKESGVCLHVMRFTDESSPADESYEDLKDSFPCFTQESLQMGSDVVEVFHALSRFLNTPVPQFRDDFEVKTVASGSISPADPLTVPPDATAHLYTLWLGRTLSRDGLECRAGDAAVELTPVTTATEIASFTFRPAEDSDVTCRLTSAKQLPALTQVRMATQRGHYFDFDIWTLEVQGENEQMPIMIYAKLYFGGYPVKDANVTTLVSLGETQETVKMLDNGRGDPDVTQHDGIYSGYFTNFFEAGNYQIAVKVNDNEGRARILKENPSSIAPTCCGSILVTSGDDGVPAFAMEKQIAFEARNKSPDDGYRPSRILDLRVDITEDSKEVILSWTAPGGGKASGYEFYAFCDTQDCEDGRLPKWLTLNQTEPEPKSYGEAEEVVFLITEEVPKIEKMPLFFAIKSVTEKGKVSDLSNMAEMLLSVSPPEPTTTTAPITDDNNKVAASDKTGIIVGGSIIGVMLLFCLLAVLYLYVIKPRRRAKPSNIDYFQDKAQNGTEVSGSFRAVPAIIRDSSMRRVESFPVLLYTHDQLKDFKKKVDPPLYKPTIAPRPWMSMNVLPSSELSKSGDSKSVGSASTLPMNDKHRTGEMKQLDDVSLDSDTPRSEEPIKV